MMSIFISVESPRIWQHCRRCTHARFCDVAFPVDGVCPHPDSHQIGALHPIVSYPQLAPAYASWIGQEPRSASLLARWQFGKAIDEADFLWLRERMPSPHADRYDGSFWFVLELCFGLFQQLGNDFSRYYDLDLTQVMPVMREAFGWAMAMSTPDTVQACVARGGDWTVCVLDLTKMKAWQTLAVGYLDFLDAGLTDDDIFRVCFEVEWRRLMDFRGERYDFRVIPKLSFEHVVRYQELPQGNPTIRRMVSAYLVHQSLVYPHVFDVSFPAFREVAFDRRIRQIYEPLLQGITSKAWCHLGLRVPQRQERADVRTQIEAAFDDFLNEFDFFPDAPPQLRGRGVLGLNEDPAWQQWIDQVLAEMGFGMRTADLSATPFAHYIQQKLRFWLQEHYPDEREWESSESDSLIGPDGRRYLSTQGAARRCGVSHHQLRRMDERGIVLALRAHEVFTESPPPVPRDFRLYEDTPELVYRVDIARNRAKTHSSALEGQEVNRKQAALVLGVSVQTLRTLEKAGKVRIVKRGRLVVYDRACLEHAKQVIERRRPRSSD